MSSCYLFRLFVFINRFNQKVINGFVSNLILIWSKFFLPVLKSLPSWDRAKSHLRKSINYGNKINLEHFLKYIFWREFHRLNPDIVLDPGILCVLWREILALAEVCRFQTSRPCCFGLHYTVQTLLYIYSAAVNLSGYNTAFCSLLFLQLRKELPSYIYLHIVSVFELSR